MIQLVIFLLATLLNWPPNFDLQNQLCLQGEIAIPRAMNFLSLDNNGYPTYLYPTAPPGDSYTMSGYMVDGDRAYLFQPAGRLFVGNPSVVRWHGVEAIVTKCGWFYRYIVLSPTEADTPPQIYTPAEVPQSLPVNS